MDSRAAARTTEWITGRSGGSTIDPADRVTLDESISMAFLVVLESMTPPQRLAFILHDVFRYSFSEVAQIVGRSSAACRQLASSARRRIGDSQAPMTLTAEQADIVRKFKRPGRTRTSRPSSACSIPMPRRSPTAADSSAPCPGQSRTASTSHVPASRWPIGKPP
jgi:hypothetical protein